MDSFQTFTAELYGTYGGFSHRAIAAKVFKKDFDSITKEEVSQIKSSLQSKGIKVTAWRNMKTEASQKYTESILLNTKPKKKNKKKLKKTG